jgi:cold shock protein
MARGTVKWFNPTKGYGFIQPQGGGKDVFVHIRAVERARLATLNEGQQVEYELEETAGGPLRSTSRSFDVPGSWGGLPSCTRQPQRPRHNSRRNKS